MELSADYLYKKRLEREHKINQEYLKIYEKCNRKIYQADTMLHRNHCVFEVPEYSLKVPSYEKKSCVVFLMYKLIKKKFDVKYIKPNLLEIKWNSPNFDPLRVENSNIMSANKFANIYSFPKNKNKIKKNKKIKTNKNELNENENILKKLKDKVKLLDE